MTKFDNQVCSKISDKQKQKLEQIIQQKETTKSNFIRQAIKQRIEKHSDNEKIEGKPVE